METKKVKIVKVTSFYRDVVPWYENKVGEVFDVYKDIYDTMGHNSYNVKDEKSYNSGLYIKVEDCEDVI